MENILQTAYSTLWLVCYPLYMLPPGDSPISVNNNNYYYIYSKDLSSWLLLSELSWSCKQKHNSNIFLPDCNKNWNILTSFFKFSILYFITTRWAILELLYSRQKDVTKLRDAFFNLFIAIASKVVDKHIYFSGIRNRYPQILFMFCWPCIHSNPEQSPPIQSDKYQCRIDTAIFSWWWARGCPKHVKNSVASVRERTTPTEQPPPVGEVSANFCG